MPFSYENKLGDGTTQLFTFSFPYMNSEHLKVYQDGIETTDFNLTGDFEVTMNTAPANGVVLRIERETPKDSAIVDFEDGSTLLETQLDANTQQSLFIVQEAFDAVESSISLNLAGRWDALNTRLINVSDPVDIQDVATKNYVDNAGVGELGATVAARDLAETYRDEAQTYRNEAQGYRDDAQAAVGSVKVSIDDTTAASLSDKVTVSNSLLLSVLNEAGDEDLNIEANIATQAEAEAGTEAFKLMTPERTKDAIAVLASTTFNGCVVFGSSATSVANNTWTSLECNTELIDTNNFHDNVTDNTHITIPSGVSKVKFFGEMNSGVTNTRHRLRIFKNGTETISTVEKMSDSGGGSFQISTPTLDVSPGDYFEFQAWQTSGSTQNNFYAKYFECEVKE